MHITRKSVPRGRHELNDRVPVEGLPPAAGMVEAEAQFRSWAAKNPDPHMDFDHDLPYNAADIFYNGDCYTIEPEGIKL